MFITPSVEPPLLMSLPNIPPFLKPMDMSNTLMVSNVALSSSSSSMALAFLVGSSHPSTKKNMEDGPSSNGGHKRIPPSLKGGPVLACSILVKKPNPTSLEFVTAPKSLGEPSGESREQPSPSIEV